MIGLQQLFISFYSMQPLPTGHRVDMKACWSLAIPPEEMEFRELSESPKAAQVAANRATISSQAVVHSRPKDVELGPDVGVPQL